MSPKTVSTPMAASARPTASATSIEKRIRVVHGGATISSPNG
jgi:hypothetical protein